MKTRYALIILLSILTVSSIHAQQPLSQSKTERLYAKGKELIDHANYGAAREIFSEFLETAPANDSRRGEAQYYVAFSALSLSHADGEKLIDEFIEKNPSSPRASSAYYDLAIFFYNDKNYTKATQYFKKVDFPALTSEQQIQGHFSYGYSLFSQKKLDEALEQFNFVKNQKSSYSPAASYYAGYAEYSNGRFDEAIIDLKRAETNPSYASIVPYLIASVYYRQHKYDELIAYAESIKSRTDLANGKEISMLVADAYYFKGDYKRAVTAYESYFDNNADKAESPLLFRAGFAYYSMGQDDKAINYLKRSASAADSSSYYASYYLGILYLKKGDKPYALNSFEYARKYEKDKKLQEESTFQYAKVAYDAGKAEVAINELEKYLKDFPNGNHDTEVKEILAQAYVNGNDFNKAIQYLEALPRRNPSLDKAYQKATYLKGTEAFNMEDYPTAVSWFEKSLQYPADNNYVALASFWSGEAYSIGRKYNDAIGHYLKAVSMTSAEQEVLTKARYGLGYAYYNTKVYDRALYNFKEFVNKTDRKAPNHTDALIRLADCYYVTKSYQEALNYYNQARNIGSPDNDYILLQNGVVNGILHNNAEARNQLNTLVASYPKSTYRDEAMFQSAQFEILQGNYQAAVDGFSKLIREAPGSSFIPYAYWRRGESYYNLKQYDKTINDYSYIVREYPGHPIAQQVLLPLQESLSLAGRSAEFENYLGQVKSANPDNKGLESVEYEAAKNIYFDQQYQKAITRLNSFITTYPQSTKVGEAKYYVAESYYRLKDYNNALNLYQEISDDMSLNLGNKVAGRIAEIDFKQANYEKAITSFHKLERLATNKKDLFNARSGLMESFYLLNRYDSVSTYANLIIEKGNVNASAQNKATLYLGKAALAKGDTETAQDEFLNTLNAARDEYGAEAKYLMAQIFYQKKDYKQCYETLISLNEDFAPYDEWVGKSYLLLADNFIATNDVFQAKATLQSLVDNFPLPAVKNEAALRLKKLEDAERKKKEALNADTLGN